MKDIISPGLAHTFPPIASASAIEIGADEILIHAPGFEDRTMALPSTVTAPAGGRALLLDYRPSFENNRLDDVRRTLLDRHIVTSEDDLIVYDRFEPGNFEETLRNRILHHACGRVLVDISTMSKLAILLVLEVCRKLDLIVRVYYAEAREYGPSKDEYERAKHDNAVHRPSLQVYTGIQGVVRVDSLASVAMQGEPTAAVVFMSFNNSLTQALLNTVYPSRLLLVNGISPHHPWREEAKAWIHDQVRREWEDDNPLGNESDPSGRSHSRAVSTLEYGESLGLLLHIYWMLSATHRMILAPAGSKMQALGCYLAKALHPDIHIEYPSPRGFFPEYSSGIGERWLVDFGRLTESLRLMADAEHRDYLSIPIEEEV